jgi:predicted nucleic acid-binding protein
MILVDTSIWVDHLREGDAHLALMLERINVLTHPFIVGEIACGRLSDRAMVLELLESLPGAVVAHPEEVLLFIESHRLFGRGIGYVDTHLLASTALTEGASLWTRDKRLLAAASELGCSYLGSARH